MNRLWLLLLLWLAQTVAAHPYHTSTLEMSLDADGHVLQLSLRMLPEDVEQIASERAGKPLTLREEKQVLEHMRKYITRYLQLRQHGQPLQLEGWSMEWVPQQVLFFFQAPIHHIDDRLTLTNRLLLDIHPDGLNIVVKLLDNGERESLLLNLRETRLLVKVEQLRREG